ncbi:hypothetical protein HanRHA438_Chr10g0437741 [Helianthus annuus]|nr:hypothetical protein HanRHA438_Chr10g0437741 [Helianthus annuus]
MEAFSYMFHKAVEVGAFMGIKIPFEGPSVSNLLYADDALILREWSGGNILNVARLLCIFHLCSGLKINLKCHTPLSRWARM